MPVDATCLKYDINYKNMEKNETLGTYDYYI